MSPDDIHNSPHPVEIATTGMSPQSREALAVAIEVILHHKHGWRDFQWLTCNDDTTLEITLLSGTEIRLHQSMKLGQVDGDTSRDLVLTRYLILRFMYHRVLRSL